MINFIKKLQTEIQGNIDSLERSDLNIIKKSLEASRILDDASDRLREFLISYDFPNEDEEIEFFKEIKPRIFCKQIYYRKIYNIEMGRPPGSIDAQKEHLENELVAINKYTNKRLDFIRYYRSGATYLDRQYFLRGQMDTEQYLESFHSYLDPKFSTNGDFKIARIMANDMLSAYLMGELESLQYETRRCGIEPFPEARLTWQASKSDLIEMIYAFDSKSCFGNVPLTQVASYFENVFNIRLDSNLSRAFSDMKTRQNPTQGLDSLKEELLKRIQHWRRKKK